MQLHTKRRVTLKMLKLLFIAQTGIQDRDTMPVKTLAKKYNCLNEKGNWATFMVVYALLLSHNHSWSRSRPRAAPRWSWGAQSVWRHTLSLSEVIRRPCKFKIQLPEVHRLRRRDREWLWLTSKQQSVIDEELGNNFRSPLLGTMDRAPSCGRHAPKVVIECHGRFAAVNQAVVDLLLSLPFDFAALVRAWKSWDHLSAYSPNRHFIHKGWIPMEKSVRSRCYKHTLTLDLVVWIDLAALRWRWGNSGNSAKLHQIFIPRRRFPEVMGHAQI